VEVRVVLAQRNGRLDALKTAIDAGSGAGTIKVYTATQATNADTALGAQTLLATLTFTDPCAGAASAGVLTFSTITEDTAADATGTAAWARIQDSSGNVVFDCDVGTSGATINFATVAFVANARIQMTSFTLTDAAA
jgi:hypothetical protein